MPTFLPPNPDEPESLAEMPEHRVAVPRPVRQEGRFDVVPLGCLADLEHGGETSLARYLHERDLQLVPRSLRWASDGVYAQVTSRQKEQPSHGPRREATTAAE